VIPSRLPDRIAPQRGLAAKFRRGVDRSFRTVVERLLDEAGPISLGLEYGTAGFAAGCLVWFCFGLIWGIVAAVAVTGGLARRRIR